MKTQNKMKLLAIAAAALGTHGAFAKVTDMGNGGHAIVCRDSSGKIASAQLLDYSDSADFKGAIDFGPGATTVREKVQTAMNRIGRFSPAFAEYLAGNAEPLLIAVEAEKSTDIVEFEDDKTLTFIPDSFHFTTPEGCKDEQLAIRTVPGEDPALGPIEYLVQRSIWSALDANNKAGLVLHEILYKYAVIAQGQSDSVKTRYVNQIVSTIGIDSMSRADLLAILKRSGFSSKADFAAEFAGDDGADVRVSLGDQTCTLRIDQLADVSGLGGYTASGQGYTEKYAFCEFDLIPGEYDYSVNITRTSGNSLVKFWYLPGGLDGQIDDETRHILGDMWFWGGKHRNSMFGVKIDSKHPLAATGKIISGLPR